MQMILKSMGVKVDKDDMESYAGEIDEAGAGKFTLAMFCQIAARFMIEDDEEQIRRSSRRPSGSTTGTARDSSPPTS